jgi:hypothetical protein
MCQLSSSTLDSFNLVRESSSPGLPKFRVSRNNLGVERRTMQPGQKILNYLEIVRQMMCKDDDIKRRLRLHLFNDNGFHIDSVCWKSTDSFGQTT